MEMDLYNTETMLFHMNRCYCFKRLDALDTSVRVKAMSNWLFYVPVLEHLQATKEK